MWYLSDGIVLKVPFFTCPICLLAEGRGACCYILLLSILRPAFGKGRTSKSWICSWLVGLADVGPELFQGV